MVLPLMLMGGLLIIGGAASLILPETLHRKLPESLEDAETFEQENRTNQLHKQSA